MKSSLPRLELPDSAQGVFEQFGQGGRFVLFGKTCGLPAIFRLRSILLIGSLYKMLPAGRAGEQAHGVVGGASLLNTVLSYIPCSQTTESS